ncbi:MAG: glycosyl hydrolase 115 family protein [Clostridiales bacterium]|nr:glycosyl hydrolase 115 family protein [Clostridiales bacterium]
MQFQLSTKVIKDGKAALLIDGGLPSGIYRIAEKIQSDMKAVFGASPEVYDINELPEKASSKIEYPIIVLMDKNRAEKKSAKSSNILTNLERSGLIDLSVISGKREVYLHKVIEKLPGKVLLPKNKAALLIAGSDKRGTIYGLFALSEKLGVSPFIDWLDVKPERKAEFAISGKYEFISKEPSVRFRGFFINDEWPAFGNWCNKRFGGFNSKCYEHVFELLLRLKGNYMWPAMWSAIFPNDGPGLASAVLADELGVVMGMSHHEPCLRQGEEYRYLRGSGSIYGDAWNFLSNEKGITKFWEDGLIRSGKFENVITVGMRGEADTAIMGKEATLKDNIDLLRKVLKTQNRLIKKYVNKDLDEVPRMLALYKEVEPYFYGDEKTPGLQGDPELEGVTLMLCDDNYGNLRTVPTPEMRDHKGGYGMYYHFDYHGYPISYEWFNTSHLPKVWEQMTTAYDCGIRELWIVNVGDIFSTEYPLSFFLDLAYDFDKWGTSNKNAAHEYTKLFVEKYFGTTLSPSQKKQVKDLLLGYTRITSARRTEAMNDEVYAPFAFEETEEMLATIEKLMSTTESLYAKLSGNVAYRFYELVYLPLMANLNVQKMWLMTTQNHAYAKIGSTYAMALAEKVNACLEFDQALVDELHMIHGGMWYGMGLSEHIGFKNWCEEGCQYPVVHTFMPGNKDRLIVTIPGTEQFSEGYFWTRKALVLPSFLDPHAAEGKIELSTGCDKKISYTIECDSNCLAITPASGTVSPRSKKTLKVKIDRKKMPKKNTEAKIIVRFGADAFIEVKVPLKKSADVMKSLERIAPEFIAIDAENHTENIPGKVGRFEVIPDYNRGLSAMKAYPQDVTFKKAGDAPTLMYQVSVPKDGKYTLRLMTNPSNPNTRLMELFVGVGSNGGRLKKVNMIPDGFAIGDEQELWKKGVLDNLRITEVDLDLKEGKNTIEISAISPNFVLTKLVLFEKGKAPMDSYYRSNSAAMR